MSEAQHQCVQYIEPPSGLMICANVQCRNVWPTDLTAAVDTEPKATPNTPNCPMCQATGRLFTHHEVTHKQNGDHGTD